MKVPILRLSYTPEEKAFIKKGIEEVLESGYLTMGKTVAEFERVFAAYTGTKHAVATSSGTSSLEIVLRALAVAGKSVVIPSNTFMATATAVVHAGGRVIFADCERDNLQLDPDDLRRKVRPDTKGVILVHIGGLISPRLDEIRHICEEQGLFLLEDAAHAHGATINGRKAGTLGIAGSFSFYPTKVMTTAEGGMITTDDDRLYEQCLVLRDHGKADPAFNVHTEFGYNWRFSELHAVLGLQQMQNAEAILAERRRIASWYDTGLEEFKDMRPLRVPANIQSSYYKYIAFLDERLDRDAVKRRMADGFSISLTGEVYAQPLHSQPVFQKYPETVANDAADMFPNSEYVAAHHVCLPLYPGLSEEEVDYVVNSLRAVIA